MKRYLIKRTVLAMAIISGCMCQVAFAGFLDNWGGRGISELSKA
jgi:hypothetical protein